MFELIASAIQIQQPVWRNTVIFEHSLDPFADLSADPHDQAFAREFIAIQPPRDRERLRYHVIDNVFLAHPYGASRFSDGRYPAWYGSIESITTIHETCYHWVHSFLEDILVPMAQPVSQERSLFQVACDAILLDLRQKCEERPELISPNKKDYDFTQRFSKKLFEQGSAGFLVLSARHLTGQNVVVFKQDTLKDPQLIQDLLYEYDPDTQQVTVQDLNTNTLVVTLKSQP